MAAKKRTTDKKNEVPTLIYKHGNVEITVSFARNDANTLKSEDILKTLMENTMLDFSMSASNAEARIL